MSVGMTDTLFPPQPRGRALAPPQDPLSQGSGDTYLQGPDFLPPGKQEQVDRDQFQELQCPHQFVVDMLGKAGSPRVRGHLLRQVELKRGPCVQQLLGPAGESSLPADPEPALSCPLLQDKASQGHGHGHWALASCPWRGGVWCPLWPACLNSATS